MKNPAKPNWFEVWNELGWSKIKDASFIREADVFRVCTNELRGAWMIALTIENKSDMWLIKSELLNQEKSLSCLDCGVKVELNGSNRTCPLCAGSLEAINSRKSRNYLTVTQKHKLLNQGVFH